MSKHIPGDLTAAFHTDFVEGESYTKEMLTQMMTFNETMANKGAASLLMPAFILERAIRKYNNGSRVVIYIGTDVVIPDFSKKIIQRMADSMGVSFSACYYRLKELDGLELRPLTEYVQYFSNPEGGYV